MLSPRWERYHVLALIVVVVAIAGTRARAPQRIIGGGVASSTEFPWQVSIWKANVHHCGGAIIGRKHILTAGHCLYQESVDEITVVAGTNSLQPGAGKIYRVKSFKIHDRYHPQVTTVGQPDHDIAVITLMKKIKENNYRKIIPLPSHDVSDGAVVVVSGFGIVADAPDYPLAATLQKLEVLIVGSIECMRFGVRVRPYEICAHNSPGSGACEGDSGSALVYNGAVVGLVSTSPDVCGNGEPDTYTRVFYYKDFIMNAMIDSSK